MNGDLVCPFWFLHADWWIFSLDIQSILENLTKSDENLHFFDGFVRKMAGDAVSLPGSCDYG
jgi:hypothetical protein